MQSHSLRNGITVELDFNWIQGVGSTETRTNPIYSLALKHHLKTNIFDMQSISTYDNTGKINVMQDLITYLEKKEEYISIAGKRMLCGFLNLYSTSSLFKVSVSKMRYAEPS